MRRVLAALTVLSLLALTPMALAVSGEQSYKDTFDSGGYAGNDGSLKWSDRWKEVGESDGPDAGAVAVEGSGCSGQCLTISTGLLAVAAGAYRLADTGNFADATLSYWVDFDAVLGLLDATLTVEATSNGGASWNLVDSVALGLGGGTRTVDVTGFRSEQFGLRFRATGALGAKVLIDNVKVSGTVPSPTTTTTTASTTTTSTSTTTTTTTLVTLPPPTLPKLSTTTTTTRPTTTTTTVRTTSTTTTTPDLEAGGSTTTIDSGETTTTVVAGGGGDDDDPGGDGDGVGLGSGLRQTSIGVGGDVPRGLFGPTPEVLGFEVAAGYANAVELIEASWVWVLGLALMIAAALIKGIDRRLDQEPAPHSEV